MWLDLSTSTNTSRGTLRHTDSYTARAFWQAWRMYTSLLTSLQRMSMLLIELLCLSLSSFRSDFHYPSLLRNIPIFLTCNIYVMLLLTCVPFFEIYSSTRVGDLLSKEVPSILLVQCRDHRTRMTPMNVEAAVQLVTSRRGEFSWLFNYLFLFKKRITDE